MNYRHALDINSKYTVFTVVVRCEGERGKTLLLPNSYQIASISSALNPKITISKAREPRSIFRLLQLLVPYIPNTTLSSSARHIRNQFRGTEAGQFHFIKTRCRSNKMKIVHTQKSCNLLFLFPSLFHFLWVIELCRVHVLHSQFECMNSNSTKSHMDIVSLVCGLFCIFVSIQNAFISLRIQQTTHTKYESIATLYATRVNKIADFPLNW